MTYSFTAWLAAMLLRQAQRHGAESLDEVVHSPRGLWRIRIEPYALADPKEQDHGNP
jgi:hypothetical protein